MKFPCYQIGNVSPCKSGPVVFILVADMAKEKLPLMQQVAYQLVMLRLSECFMK